MNKLPDFHRAALQRLEAAELLCDATKNLDAMYLAGYAAECALKAILARATPRKRHMKLLLEFRGQKAHNFDFLKELMRKARVSIPDRVHDSLRMLATWSTELRYQCGFRDPADAKMFVNAARSITGWMERMR